MNTKTDMREPDELVWVEIGGSAEVVPGKPVSRSRTLRQFTRFGLRWFEVHETMLEDIAIMKDDMRASLRNKGYKSFFVAKLLTQTNGSNEISSIDVRVVPYIEFAQKQCQSLSDWLKRYTGSALIAAEPRVIADADAGLFLSAVMLGQMSALFANHARDLMEAHERLRELQQQLYADVEALRREVGADESVIKSMNILRSAVL